MHNSSTCKHYLHKANLTAFLTSQQLLLSTPSASFIVIIKFTCFIVMIKFVHYNRFYFLSKMEYMYTVLCEVKSLSDHCIGSGYPVLPKVQICSPIVATFKGFQKWRILFFSRNFAQFSTGVLKFRLLFDTHYCDF